MAADRRAQGSAVEQAAAEFLIHAGLRRVAANVGYRGGELDLVMRDGDVLVFVEVRYRRSSTFGGGAASIDAGKRRRLIHAALAFLAQHAHLSDVACRFDVIEAEGDPASPRLHWIKDAFRADEG